MIGAGAGGNLLIGAGAGGNLLTYFSHGGYACNTRIS
jgi:hypothetical protein